MVINRLWHVMVYYVMDYYSLKYNSLCKDRQTSVKYSRGVHGVHRPGDGVVRQVGPGAVISPRK